MSYYNRVAIVFAIGDEYLGQLDWRYATQMLPTASIPVAVVSANTEVLMSISNSRAPEEIYTILENVEYFKDIKTFDIISC